MKGLQIYKLYFYVPRHDSFIPHLTYPAPLEPGSQAVVGLTSTAMGDLAGISGDESFFALQITCRCRSVFSQSFLH